MDSLKCHDKKTVICYCDKKVRDFCISSLWNTLWRVVEKIKEQSLETTSGEWQDWKKGVMIKTPKFSKIQGQERVERVTDLSSKLFLSIERETQSLFLVFVQLGYQFMRFSDKIISQYWPLTFVSASRQRLINDHWWLDIKSLDIWICPQLHSWPLTFFQEIMTGIWIPRFNPDPSSHPWSCSWPYFCPLISLEMLFLQMALFSSVARFSFSH